MVYGFFALACKLGSQPAEGFGWQHPRNAMTGDSPTEDAAEVHRNVNESADKPWKDKELVNHLYHDKEMSGPEIADELDCSVGPIYDRIEDVRSLSESNKLRRLQEPASFRTDEDGYERVGTKIDGARKTMAVHRLVAIAEFGVGSVKNKIVHHEKNIPWLNTPNNLEIMDQSDHVREHFEEIAINDKLAMLEWSENTPATHAQISKEKEVPRTTVNSIVARAKGGDANV